MSNDDTLRAAADVRAQQLELIQPLRSISLHGGRGLAMLAKAVALLDTPVEDFEEAAGVSANLVCYCVRESLDSIFPKLEDPKIRDVSQRLLSRWQKLSGRPDADLAFGLRDEFASLSEALGAATAGFVPRVSGLLGALYPRLDANVSIPAMTTLRDLYRAANAGVHGGEGASDSAALLDSVLEHLVELVVPLAITAPQYQALTDAGDFARVARSLSANSDPRIRVFLFEHVRGPGLAQALELAEILPGQSVWFAYGYLRRLAEDSPVAFIAFVERVITEGRMNAATAAQLLACATLGGVDLASEVDRLTRIAGDSTDFDLVSHWLQRHGSSIPESVWWRVLTQLVPNIDLSGGGFRFAYGLDELVRQGVARAARANARNRERFAKAIFVALARLETSSPYSVQFHCDNPQRTPSASTLLIDAATQLVALAVTLDEPHDVSALSDLSRLAIERASAATLVATLPADRADGIAEDSLASTLARISAGEWPDSIDLKLLPEVLPRVRLNQVSLLTDALGSPPGMDELIVDLANSSIDRAAWFRLAQWASYLPEAYCPQPWRAALNASSEHGITFGPPTHDTSVEPAPHESPLTGLDVANTAVVEFVDLLNSAVAASDQPGPRSALKVQELITAHVNTHRQAWLRDTLAIGRVSDWWMRLAILRELRSDANDTPRVEWIQLVGLWTQLVTEFHKLGATQPDGLKPALARSAQELLEQLSHRATERPREAEDVDWWTEEVLPATVSMAAWIGDAEPDTGMPALFSVRGAAVRLFVMLSSPIVEDDLLDAALCRGLDALTEIAQTDTAFVGCLGRWAQWLIRREPRWWEQSSDKLIGPDNTNVREVFLTANWESGAFADELLGADFPLLNGYASRDLPDAAEPVLYAVLHDVVPISAVWDTTWSAIFRDVGASGNALRYLFPSERVEQDPQSAKRLRMLESIATVDSRATAIWRSSDVLAASSDVDNQDLFGFLAKLSTRNRGAPASAHFLANRFINSLADPNAVTTLEAMCAGNLGAHRTMAQFDMEGVYVWFSEYGSVLPVALRTRVDHSLFELGYGQGN